MEQAHEFHLFSVIFVHASLRLRSINNKLGNKLEAIGFKSTPMGHLLRMMDIEIELMQL